MQLTRLSLIPNLRSCYSLLKNTHYIEMKHNYLSIKMKSKVDLEIKMGGLRDKIARLKSMMRSRNEINAGASSQHECEIVYYLSSRVTSRHALILALQIKIVKQEA